MHTISGLVLDSKTKKPIASVLVTAKLATTTTTPDETTYSDRTNDAGRFTIEVPEQGS